MSDIVADAKTWLADIKSGQRLQTHSEECHKWHSTCLVGKLIREIERLRLLVPPIAGTVNAKTGMDFVPIRIDGWIQVSDRLPPDGEYVLWWNPKDDYLKYRLAARDGSGLDWGGDLLEPIAAFTHWRHLPGSPTTIVK